MYASWFLFLPAGPCEWSVGPSVSPLLSVSVSVSVSVSNAQELFSEAEILHGFSVLCHVGLLLALSSVWLFRRSRAGKSSKERAENNTKKSFLHYKLALFSSLALALLYLILSVYNFLLLLYGGRRRRRRSDDEQIIAAQLDFGIRVVSWSAASAYLLFEFGRCGEKRFPPFLRIWWGLFFLLSCSSLALSFFYSRDPELLFPPICGLSIPCRSFRV
uniref:Uncharacterized protein n=1 Tax=Ananas comosus var. bracteatus TaxID=296719 RepID=A0A6V7QJ72_ANACO|nr:unnamed protein product [Ananas comosus var. bracteatus]